MSGEVRSCTTCEQVKSTDEFPFSKRNGKPEAKCFLCRNAYQRQWRALRCSASRRSTYAEAEIEALRACIEAEMTPEEVAQKLGRTAVSIKSARLNYHLPKFKRRPREVQDLKFIPAIARVVLARGSYSVAGSRIGKSKNAVAGIVYRNRAAFEAELASCR